MEENEIYSELASIRSLMERSAKFISLSGLSGVAAGVYALIGAVAGYKTVCKSNSCFPIADSSVNDASVFQPLFIIATIVLILSVGTCLLLTIRKAKQKNENAWNPISRRLLANTSIPLLTGAVLALILINNQTYSMIIPSCLIFYGLSLVSASIYTFTDIKWLGLCEILLGLLAAANPGYAFVCWVVGFGILHIVYGLTMHFKYER